MNMGSFQVNVFEWMRKCFGLEVTRDKKTRAQAFIEEALEVVQAAGLGKEGVIRQVEYTYGRPIGNVEQEVGGLMITLAALCTEYRIDITECAVEELRRCIYSTAMIRAKQHIKVAAGIRHLLPEEPK